MGACGRTWEDPGLSSQMYDFPTVVTILDLASFIHSLARSQLFCAFTQDKFRIDVFMGSVTVGAHEPAIVGHCANFCEFFSNF